MEEGFKETKFIDAEQWTGSEKEKLTFREIVLYQVKKILQNANVEFRGGYWEHRPSPNPQSNLTIDVYIIDAREVYSNSVEALHDILLPHFDKEMKKASELIKTKIEKALKTYTVEKEREDTNSKEGVEIDREFSNIKDRVSYRTTKREIIRELFQELCCFLKRIDYLKGKSFEDEA